MLWFWLTLIIFSIATEAATKKLLAGWVIFGSLAAMVATFYHLPIWAQIPIFAAITGALIYFVRPYALKLLARGDNDNAEANCEKECAKEA